jgi:dihydrofolate reductase
MPVTLIVARAQAGVIGRGNTLPWHLPEDLRHFKACTLGHAVIMGRKTFESIGKPLPGRRNIVLSHTPGWQPAGIEVAASLAQAIALARAGGPASAAQGARPDGTDAADPEIFVAGGANVYAQARAFAHRALITQIDLQVPGDAYFPDLDPTEWQQVGCNAAVSATGIAYSIVEMRRVAPPALPDAQGKPLGKSCA